MDTACSIIIDKYGTATCDWGNYPYADTMLEALMLWIREQMEPMPELEREWTTPRDIMEYRGTLDYKVTVYDFDDGIIRLTPRTEPPTVTTETVSYKVQVIQQAFAVPENDASAIAAAREIICRWESFFHRLDPGKDEKLIFQCLNMKIRPLATPLLAKLTMRFFRVDH